MRSVDAQEAVDGVAHVGEDVAIVIGDVLVGGVDQRCIRLILRCLSGRVDRGGRGSVTVSNPLATTVAQKRRLNSNGVVPLALGIPAVLALGLILVRRRRRSLI